MTSRETRHLRSVRPFRVEFFNKQHKYTKADRRYASPESALRKGLEILLLEGRPGDRLTVSHVDTGLEVGSIVVGVNGNFHIKRIFD